MKHLQPPFLRLQSVVGGYVKAVYSMNPPTRKSVYQMGVVESSSVEMNTEQ